MAYERINFEDYVTPLNAEIFERMDDGIAKAHQGIDAITPFANAGAHNAIYRGAFLGNAVTPEQQQAIFAGTFEDLYIGDYWSINGITWRIAAFDYFLNCGDVATKQHHLVMVPDTILYTAVMNETPTTDGGYVLAFIHTSGLEEAKSIIIKSFGDLLLSHRIYLVNAVSDGIPSAGAWCDSVVDLMTEQMVYGCGVLSPVSDGTTIPANGRIEKSQLPLFSFAPEFICNRSIYWLRDVVSATSFACVYTYGHAASNTAANSRGVRPYFLIGGGAA